METSTGTLAPDKPSGLLIDRPSHCCPALGTHATYFLTPVSRRRRRRRRRRRKRRRRIPVADNVSMSRPDEPAEIPEQMSFGEQLLHVDIRIDEAAPERGVLELLGRLRPDWRPPDVQMKTFTEGITNKLMGCFVGSLQERGGVLVRLYGRMTELYVNRRREVEMFQLFHAHGCGPQIYCSFRNGICYEFVKGTVLEDALLHQPSIYRLIAAELGRIHAIRPAQPSPSPSGSGSGSGSGSECGWGRPVQPLLWNKMSHFLTLVQSSSDKGSSAQPASGCEFPSVERLWAEMESLRAHLSRLGSPTVLCHNDLLTKNIIYNHKEERVKFIDYEYADYNYQAFDIGNHFNEFAGVTEVDYSRYPGPELQRDWLTTYLHSYKSSLGLEVSVSEPEVTRLYVQVCKFSLASNFFWALWAILQSRFSSIDFDFQRYATARLNYYFEKKEEYLRLTLN